MSGAARPTCPDQRHRPKWQLALDMLDELAGWELVPPVGLADAAYGEVSEVRLGLEQRALAYVVQVPGTISAYPQDVPPETVPSTGRGRRPVARYHQPRSSLRQLVLATGEWAATTVIWREGAAGAPLASRLSPCGCARPRSGCAERPAVGSCRCAGCWPNGPTASPVKYWLANLPETTPLRQLVHLAKLRWRVEHDYRELKDALGLDHFEGRSWQGWHHHVTLASVAHAFVTLERLDPKAATSV